MHLHFACLDLSWDVDLQPAVTLGNVGQLATDLLLSTLQLPRIGFLETTAVLPCAGNDAFKHQAGVVAVSLELYHFQQDGQPDTFVLQQRSPAAKGCQQRFAKELSVWIANAGFGEVSLAWKSLAPSSQLCSLHKPQACCIPHLGTCMPACDTQHFLGPGHCQAEVALQVLLLSSLDAMLRRDRQIAQQQVTYITQDAALQQHCCSLEWNQLQASTLLSAGNMTVSHSASELCTPQAFSNLA